MRYQNYFLVVLIGLQISCSEQGPANPLEAVLSSKDDRIKRVMDSIDQYEVQIRYTKIDRRNDSIIFNDFDFQVDESIYFYPASTVKFPAAVAALEKLNEIDTLSRNTLFYVEGDSIKTTFARAIEEIFAVSDNAANNRLIEFIGQDNLNKMIRNRGVRPIRISHRLSTPNADDIVTKPLIIYLNDSTTATTASIISASATPLQLKHIKKGKGFLSGDSLYSEPFDFGLKNYYPIHAQHELLKRVIFPNQFPKEKRFNLSKEQRTFLLKAMHTLPKNAGYDAKEYYDSYGKFFMYGDSEGVIPDYIKIFNKVGYAYGTLTDCAYIIDEKNKIDFMVTATILVNKDGIFNNDNYEYDEIGIPFLAQLGRELYHYELESNK